MAGDFSRTLGVLLIVLGVVAILAGSGAAAYGLFLQNQVEEDGIFADPDAVELSEALPVYGLIGGGAGLVILLLGIVLQSIGRGQFERSLIQAQGRTTPPSQSSPGPAPHPARGRRGTSIAGGAVALTLLAGLVIWATAGGGSLQLSSLASSSDDPAERPPLDTADFEGSVTGGASVGPIGSATSPASDSVQEFTAPAQTGYFSGLLNWTPESGGTDTLRIILERSTGEGWEELTSVEGGAPLKAEVAGDDLSGADLRYRVFPGGPGGAVLSQSFHITLEFWASAP